MQAELFVSFHKYSYLSNQPQLLSFKKQTNKENKNKAQITICTYQFVVVLLKYHNDLGLYSPRSSIKFHGHILDVKLDIISR